jgi:hypothetical protein
VPPDLRALVTGASAGIGAEFARRLRARGRRLVLVARRGDRLRELQQELGGAEAAAVVPADLASPDGPERVCQELARLGLGVELLVNNAGLGCTGRFQRNDPARLAQLCAVNVAALVLLTRLLLPPMLERRSGAVVNVASTAGFQPVPFFSAYAASKAFVVSFSQALAVELRGSGVHVQLLCPGPTHSEFFDSASHEGLLADRLPRASPGEVVEASLNGLERRRERVVVGAANQLLARLVGVLPLPLVRAVAGRLYRPS